VDLVDNILNDIKRVNAAGLDSLSIEHLNNSHPILTCVLARLFNQILRIGDVPT